MPDSTSETAARADLSEGQATRDTGRGSNLADIADAAGVSVSTVSRALRGLGGVSEATTRRIQNLAEDLAYRSSRQWHEEAIELHCLLPMKLFDADAAGFYREIVEGIQKAADAEGLPFSLTLLEEGANSAQRIRALGGGDTTVGLLLVGTDDPDIQAAAAETGHVVLVNVHDRSMRFDAVTPANHSGGYLATRHLLELGHRRIAHFTWLQRSTIKARFAGYKRALEEFGVPFDPDLVFTLSGPSPNESAAVARKALKSGKLDATAIFCASDMVGLGVASALYDSGLSIAEDVSVVGFDNTGVTARHKPALTTMEVDLVELGRQCVQRMQERARYPDRPAVYCQIGCRLIDRGSTRPRP